MRPTVATIGLVGALLMTAEAATAQDATLHPDTSAAVVAALSYARNELLRIGQLHGNRQHLINRARTDRGSAWSDVQLRAFGAVLNPEGMGSIGVKSCDSRRRECPYTAATDIVTIGAPGQRGDSVVVDIELEFPTNGARAPVALRRHRYVVVRKSGHWVVVKSDMVSAT